MTAEVFNVTQTGPATAEELGITLAPTRPTLSERFYSITPVRRAMIAVSGLALGAAGCGGAEALSHDPSGNQPVAGLSVKGGETADLSQALTVKLTEADCVAIIRETDPNADSDGALTTQNGTTYVTPHIGATDGLSANGAGDRLFSDSIEGPLPTPNHATLSLLEVEASICKDPLFGSTVANMFATMEVDGVKIVVLDPWLAQFNFDASQPENAIAQEAMSYFPETDPSNDTISETAASNQAYTQLAERLVTLLSRFQNNGEGTFQTSFNYVLSGGGLVAAEMPQVYLNPQQYDATAIWLELTKKTGGCYVTIGFNVGDQRPEGANVCEVVPPTEVTPASPAAPAAPGHPKHFTPNQPTSPGTPNTPPPVTRTTFIGPKSNPHPPVPGGEATTIPPSQPGGPTPTTYNTAPPATETTVPANTSTSTSSPAGGCGAICNN